MSRIRIAGPLLLLLLMSAPAWGEDRVVIQSPGQSSRVTVSGHIEDYNGRELILRTGVGTGVQRFPHEEVIEVLTQYTAPHEEGRRQLQAGHPELAWESLSRALEAEERKWVRREILALQVQCALWEQKYPQAASRFLAMAESDLHTRHFRLIPLAWGDDPLPGMAIAEARTWLRSSSGVARLIGASWLLNSADDVEARQVLDQLGSDPHPYVQRLAQAQLWRVRFRDPSLAKEELRHWEQLTENFPEVLRAGPQLLIGRGYAERQEWLPAAAAWLWIPLVHFDRRDLAAEALWLAAQALEAAGDPSAAERLGREALSRYPEASTTSATRELVDRLSKSGTPATMPDTTP